MTLIEQIGRRPPCVTCKARTSCTEESMRVCAAFALYGRLPPRERGRMMYRKHLRWMMRNAIWRE